MGEQRRELDRPLSFRERICSAQPAGLSIRLADKISNPKKYPIEFV